MINDELSHVFPYAFIVEESEAQRIASLCTERRSPYAAGSSFAVVSGIMLKGNRRTVFLSKSSYDRCVEAGLLPESTKPNSHYHRLI